MCATSAERELRSDAAQREGVPDGASNFNRLVQCGRSPLACKNATSHGQGGPITNVCLLGNMHDTTFIEMLRGERGNHEAACMERLLFVTARPVSPHAAVDESLDLPDGFQRFMWVPLLPSMVDSLGLRDEALQMETAKTVYEEVAAVDGCPCFAMVLADGTETRLRFKACAPCHPFVVFRVPSWFSSASIAQPEYGREPKIWEECRIYIYIYYILFYYIILYYIILYYIILYYIDNIYIYIMYIIYIYIQNLFTCIKLTWGKTVGSNGWGQSSQLGTGRSRLWISWT